MKPLKNRLKLWLLGFMLFCIAFAAVYLTMPKHDFRYNIEVAMSPIGMSLSRMYADMPETAPENFQGFIHNGEYVIYRNWLPASFKVLASWFNLTNHDDVFTARILSALVYALNALLFFILLLKFRLSKQVAFLSSIIFILLPSHLDFGALIYADIWFPTFWLLALLVLHRNRPYTYLLFFLVLLIGFRFHSFVIVLLPAPLLLYLLQKFNFKLLPSVLISTLSALLILSIEWYFINRHSNNYLFQALAKYSLFGMIEQGDFHYLWFLKRLISLIFEGGFLIAIVGFLGWRRIGFTKSLILHKEVNYALGLLFFGLLFYIVAFTNWFGIHRHGVSMFAILFAVSGAYLLSNLEKSSKLLRNKAGLTAIGICLILFATLPLVTTESLEAKYQDDKLITFINSQRQDDSIRIAVFFDIDIEENSIGLKYSDFAISVLTRCYTFELKDFSNKLGTKHAIYSGINKLEALGMNDFHTEKVIVVTEKQIDLAEMQILDSISVNNLKAYYLTLNVKP